MITLKTFYDSEQVTQLSAANTQLKEEIKDLKSPKLFLRPQDYEKLKEELERLRK